MITEAQNMEKRVKGLLRDLLFGIKMSVRYHNSRESFFVKWARFVKLLSVLSSSAVVANVIASGPDWLFIVAGLFVAFSQALDLVFDFNGLVYKHRGFADEFISLESEIVDALNNSTTTEATYRVLMTKRHAVERREGPTLFWLAVSARNAQIGRATGTRFS